MKDLQWWILKKEFKDKSLLLEFLALRIMLESICVTLTLIKVVRVFSVNKMLHNQS